jgi:hypothetical protein
MQPIRRAANEVASLGATTLGMLAASHAGEAVGARRGRRIHEEEDTEAQAIDPSQPDDFAHSDNAQRGSRRR